MGAVDGVIEGVSGEGGFFFLEALTDGRMEMLQIEEMGGRPYRGLDPVGKYNIDIGYTQGREESTSSYPGNPFYCMLDLTWLFSHPGPRSSNPCGRPLW